MLRNLFIAALAVFTVSCDFNTEETDLELAPPSIKVTPTPNSPYPGDTVIFSIEVDAVGGLNFVAFENQTLRTYPEGIDSDLLTHQIHIPEATSFGNRSYNFVVIDRQIREKRGAETVVLDVQNPAFRGSPILIANFNAIPPDPFVFEVFSDFIFATDNTAYQIKANEIDPINRNNRVLSVIRNPAMERDFNGIGALQINLTDTIRREDVVALISGERVLQMNIFFQEVTQLVTAHKTPVDFQDSATENVDISWNLAAHSTAVWNFDQQTEVKGIPVLIELGNNLAWNNNQTGNSSGRLITLIGALTVSNEWQTVTFSATTGDIFLGSDGLRNYNDIVPISRISNSPATIEDESVALNQINRIAIQLNNRITGFDHPDGWLEIPSAENGNQSNIPYQIRDDHNTYFIDNVRIIDTDEFDQNPNE